MKGKEIGKRAEAFFKEKFGNELRSHDLWVIRFAAEFAEQEQEINESILQVCYNYVGNQKDSDFKDSLIKSLKERGCVD